MDIAERKLYTNWTKIIRRPGSAETIRFYVRKEGKPNE
jgi:hypothetical protein